MLQLYQDLLGHGTLEGIGGQRGQVGDRVREHRARRHDADQQRGAVARELVGDDDPDAVEVVAMEIDARRPAGRNIGLELPQHRGRDGGNDDPQEGLDNRLGGPALLPAEPVQRARLAHARVPVVEVLADTAPDLGTTRRVREDLDEAEDLRDAAQKAEAGALRPARGVRIMADISVPGASEYFVLDDSDTGGSQGLLTNSFGDQVEGVMHGAGP